MSMIEKAARALAEQFSGGEISTEEWLDPNGADMRVAMRRAVGAVTAALMEPSEAMLEAAWNIPPSDGWSDERTKVEWQAMLKAAAREEST